MAVHFARVHLGQEDSRLGTLAVTTRSTCRCHLPNGPAAEWLCALEVVFILFSVYYSVCYQDCVLSCGDVWNREDKHCGSKCSSSHCPHHLVIFSPVPASSWVPTSLRNDFRPASRPVHATSTLCMTNILKRHACPRPLIL